MYAISLWKDTLFCIAFFFYIIFIGNVALSNNEILKKTKGIIKYLVLTFFVVFLRNNGIYIVFITLFVLIISHYNRQLKRFYIFSILELLLFFIIQGPIYNHYHLNTEFVENLGIPILQISYTVSKNGRIEKQEKQNIN